MPVVPGQTKVRAVIDPTSEMEVVKDSATAAMNDVFPIVGKTRELRLSNVHVDDKPDWHDLRGQMDAKLNEKTWGVPLNGTLSLVDKQTGKVLDKRDLRLAELPKLTPRLSYLVNGQEYQLDKQWRLKPGIYARVKDNGELESHINVAGGERYALNFDPTSRRFMFDHAGSSIPLFPMLRALGVDDSTLKLSWGKEIYDANATEKYEGAIRKFYRVSTGKEAPSLDVAVQHLRQTLPAKELSADVTEHTLGVRVDRLNGQALALASKNLLQIARGQREPDDRDAILFKNLFSTEDYVGEKLRVMGSGFRRRMTNTIDRHNNLEHLVYPGMFDKAVSSVFTESAVSRIPTQDNPVEMLEGFSRTTIIGPGAIGDTRMVTDEAKAVDKSHLGFIDPIDTPEGEKVGIASHLALGVSKKGNELFTPVYDVRQKKMVPINTATFYRSKVALPDSVRWVDRGGTKVPEPVDKQVRVAGPGNDMVDVPWGEVDYVIPNAGMLMGTGTNLVPFAQNNSGNRLSMSARHLGQTVPLKHREAALVQSAGPGDVSMDRLPGSLTAMRAHVSGTVTKVERGAIHIRDAAGKTHTHQIYDYFPLNDQRTGIHAEPSVKVGDQVKDGQLIADSWFTNKGHLAIGRNMRTGFLALPVMTHEDSVVISESAARNLASLHLHRHQFAPDENTKKGKAPFTAYYPVRYGSTQLDKLDADGIIREGQKVAPGDPLTLALRPQQYTTETQAIARLSKSLVKPYADVSTTWEQDVPGTVVRVHKMPDGRAHVVVATEEPAQIADKLCYAADTEVLTTRGWVLIGELTLADEVATLSVEGRLVYQHPVRLDRFENDEDLYHIKSQQVDLLVTLDHRMYVRRRGHPFELVPARRIQGRQVEYKKDAIWIGKDPPTFVVPPVTATIGRNTWTTSPRVFPMELWMELLGYYCADGFTYRVKGNYAVGFAKTRRRYPALYERIYTLLTTSGLLAFRSPEKIRFHDKQLHMWFRALGQGRAKKIPRFIGDLSPRLIRIFLLAYQACDGHRGATAGHITADSWIEAGYIQELCLKAGWAGNAQVLEPPVDRCSFTQGRTWVNVSSPSYRVRIVKSKLTPSVNHGHVHEQKIQIEERVPYQGSVYCCEVPNHVLYVRRNGIPVWCGNSTRHAFKGTIGQILPDDQMPKDKAGKPMDILFNPYSIPGRQVVGQVYEMAAGKIALKTGKPYMTRNYQPGVDYGEQLRQELKQHGLDEQEELFDAQTGASLGKALVGPTYILKQRHQVDRKIHARAGGPGYPYDVDRQPRRGGEGGAQSLGGLGELALLAHGARSILREAHSSKSDMVSQDEMWRAIQLGQPLPPPKPTFAQRKFEGYLNTLGVRLKKDGTQIQMVPLTDHETLRMSSGALKKPNLTLKGHELVPEAGGLFDPHVTGGIDGEKMSHIQLPESIPNPFFERGVLALTGMTQDQLLDVLGGRLAVDKERKLVPVKSPGSRTGSEAVGWMLDQVDVVQDAKAVRTQLPKLTGTQLDRANRKLRYLEALDGVGLRPRTAYMTSVIPVLPPTMRPLTVLPTGDLASDPLNETYKALGTVVSKYEDLDPGLPDRSKGRLRKELYTSLAALQGVGAGYKRIQGGETQGIMDVFTQPTAKHAWIFQRLFKPRQDLSARSVITPDPNITIDEVGVPHRIATEIFKPFTVRELSRVGYSPLQAEQMIKANDPMAEASLAKVMNEKLVLMKRDPVLHRYGIQALKPIMRKGLSITINPMIAAGFGADFDGDTTSLFVPQSPAAQQEARKMLPSANLLHPASGRPVYSPTNEMQLGLFRATTIKPDPNAPSYKTVEEALAAATSGKQKWGTISVGGRATTMGRVRLWATLPIDLRKDAILYDPNMVWNAKTTGTVLEQLAKTHAPEYATVVQKVMNLGASNVYEQAFSLSLGDFRTDTQSRDAAFRTAAQDIRRLPSGLSKTDRDAKTVGIWVNAGEAMEKAHWDKVTANPPQLAMMAMAGVKPSKDQYKQLVLAPMVVAGIKGKPIPVPVGHSFSEGLTTSDFWTQAQAARVASMRKTQEVREPGYLSKQIINTVADTVVASKDCGTTEGIAMAVDHPDVTDRYLAKTAPGAAAGSLVTQSLVDHWRKEGTQTVIVRSPLKCKLPQGICQKCAGTMGDGHVPEIGTNIGVIAGQALGERSTQLMLKAVHSGGAVSKGGGASAINQFDRIEHLLRMPQVIPNAAVLAEGEGVVKSVRPDPAGGFRVGVDVRGKVIDHHVPGTTKLAPDVRAGYRVSAGTPLSVGNINMHDLLRTAGLPAVQNQITNELDDIYRPQGIRRRNVEVIVRGVTNLGQVEDAGGHEDMRRGDMVRLSVVNGWNEKHKDHIKVNPMLKGIAFAPLDLTEDWMSKLHHERLKDTLVDAALEGHRSNIAGYNPFSAVAFSPRFGIGDPKLPGSY